MSDPNDKHFKQDRRFFDTFMLVLGILIAVAGALWFLAHRVGAQQAQQVASDPVMQQAVADRIAPVAKVAVAGQDNSALEEPVAGAGAAAEPVAAMGGEEVYNTACVACHGAGVAGAPKLGDAAAWGPRITQGADTLNKHAIEGYQGSAGFMPPKGGRVDLSDESVINAVEYMVKASQ